jgi:hypothetical protein
MNTNELQIKYKNLSDALNNLKIEKAKAEAQLDNILIQKEEAFNEIKNIAKVNSVSEAEEKLEKVKLKLEELAKEAAEILNEQ